MVLCQKRRIFERFFMIERIRYILISVLVSAAQMSAQQMGTAVNTFMDFPVSAHVAALGGNNVSYIGKDAMFAVSNPALLSVNTDNLLYLNYAVYMVGTGYGSAAYSMKFSDKDAFSVGFQFAQYGKLEGYDETETYIGNFSANDFALNATYSRYLNKYFTIGVTAKPVLNTYERYTFFSLGVDIGVQFVDTASMVSLGLAVRNFGGQIAGPEDITMTSKWMPINVTLGLTKRFKHAPFALHLTLQNLQKWDYDYATNSYEENAGKVNAGLMIGKKFIVGVDIIPRSEKFWIGISYNFDRGLSLGNPYVFSLSGLSAGAGLRLYMFQIGVGVAFYSTAAVTGHFSVAMDINGFNKKKL
jgi:hypothetical protein